MVEKLSDQNYYDYVQQHIYDAVGMKNSGSAPTTQWVANLALGYTPEGDGELRANTDTLPGRGGSAGGGDSTVGDLLVERDQALRGSKLLSARRLTQTVTTGKDTSARVP